MIASNLQGWFVHRRSGVNSAGKLRQYLGQWYFYPSSILRGQRLHEGTDKAAEPVQDFVVSVQFYRRFISYKAGLRVIWSIWIDDSYDTQTRQQRCKVFQDILTMLLQYYQDVAI